VIVASLPTAGLRSCTQLWMARSSTARRPAAFKFFDAPNPRSLRESSMSSLRPPLRFMEPGGLFLFNDNGLQHHTFAPHRTRTLATIATPTESCPCPWNPAVEELHSNLRRSSTGLRLGCAPPVNVCSLHILGHSPSSSQHIS